MPKSALAAALAAPRTADPAAAIKPAEKPAPKYPKPPSRQGTRTVCVAVPEPMWLVLTMAKAKQKSSMQAMLMRYITDGLRADGEQIAVD